MATKPTADEAADDAAADASIPEAPVAVSVDAEPAVAAQATAEPAAAEPASTADSGVKVVVVEAPVPPKKRGNRVVGVLLALLAAIVFGVVYAGAGALLFAVVPDPVVFTPIGSYSAFVASSILWVPVLFFAIGFILLVLVLNRAGWWSHVLGSLVVAAIVYFGSIGLLMLIGLPGLPGVFGGGNAGTLFQVLALTPFLLLATVVAREAAIWFGLAIAARGRRVKARNAERLAQFHADLEAKKAEHEHAAPQAV